MVNVLIRRLAKSGRQSSRHRVSRAWLREPEGLNRIRPLATDVPLPLLFARRYAAYPVPERDSALFEVHRQFAGEGSPDVRFRLYQ